MAGGGDPGHDILPQPGLHPAGPVPSHLFDRGKLQPVGLPRRGGAELPLLMSGPRMSRTRSPPLLFAALSLGAVLTTSAARADRVGSAAAVNTSSSGTAPGCAPD